MSSGEVGVEPDERLRIPHASWQEWQFIILIAALTVLGGWLRFRAIAFGLPDDGQHLFRPDEEILVLRALNFGSDWNPHIGLYPPAQMYLQSAALRIYASLKGHNGDFRAFYQRDNSARAYLISRRLTAVLGTATIVVIYFSAAPVCGPIAGLCAAAIVALLTLHVCGSKFATTDIAAGFWTTLAIAMLLRIAWRGWRRDYLLAGVFSGIATATKYPAGLIAIAAVITHLEAMGRDRIPLRAALSDGRLYLLGAALVAALFMSAPYLFLDWARTKTDFAFQWRQSFAVSGSFGWSWLLMRALPDCFGIVLELLIFAGIALAPIRRRPEIVGLATFAVIEFIVMVAVRRPFYRYLLIPLPAVAILIGILVSDLEQKFCIRSGHRSAIFITAMLLGVLLTPFLINDIQLNELLARSDTRVLAARWIEKNIPPGSTIAVTAINTPWGKPQFPGIKIVWDTQQCPGCYRTVPIADLASLTAARVRWVLSDSLRPLSNYSPEPSDSLLAELKAQANLVLDINPIRPGSAKPVFDSGDAFYAPLANASSMERPGPRIRIWELK